VSRLTGREREREREVAQLDCECLGLEISVSLSDRAAFRRCSSMRHGNLLTVTDAVKTFSDVNYYPAPKITAAKIYTPSLTFARP